MPKCVIADDMAASGAFADDLRMLHGIFANYKEGGSNFVTVEKIEKLWGHRRIRTVVERDGELARRICMSDHGTKDF